MKSALGVFVTTVCLGFGLRRLNRKWSVFLLHHKKRVCRASALLDDDCVIKVHLALMQQALTAIKNTICQGL